MLNQQLTHKKQQAWKKMSKGHHAEAISILKKVLKVAPNDAETLYLFGCCQAGLHFWNEAKKSLENSIKIQPDIPQSHFSLAGVCIALNQLDEATSCLKTALKFNPNLADAYVVLGDIQIKQGNFPDAKESFNKAIKIDKKTSDAYLGLGLLETDAGYPKRAIHEFELALQYNPESVAALCAMANSLSNLTRKNEAEVLYRKALKIDKNCYEAQCSIAMLHNFNAEYDKAIKLIEPLLKKKIRYSTLAVAFAQSCKHSGRCTEAIEYVNDVLKKPGLSQSEIKGLHFSAGKVLDSMGRYDDAFKHYKQANDAITYLYDSVASAKYISDIIEVFSPALFISTPAAKTTGKRPIFIVGMPRSGTSLTEQIMAAHSNVYAAGELETLFNISCEMKNDLGGEDVYPFYVKKLNKDNLEDMATTYLKKLSDLSAQEEYVTDKMPHNFYLLGLIQLLFPDARVIHCKRDPMDTCLSNYFQDFTEAHKYAKNLFDIGTHYHQYQRLMEHWKNVLSIPILDVSYEDLVNDQEVVTRRILGFCDLDWQEDCLQFYNVKRTIDTASFDQVRKPLYTKSVQRWRHYEKYLDKLKEGLGREF